MKITPKIYLYKSRDFEHFSRKKGVKKIDHYDFFLKDIFEINFPHLYKKDNRKEFENFRENFLSESEENLGYWVYYPWLNSAYRCPSEEKYHQIITARNKPLISEFQQERFLNFNIGIVGLSVGQSSALMLVRSGGCRKMKICDGDTIDPSNLNRLHCGLPAVGDKKTDSVSRLIYENNPYQKLEVLEDRLSKKNVVDFFEKNFKLDAVIDACDSFEAKMLIRKYAEKYKIPVIMATDLSDAVLLDVERYDLKTDQKPFNGRIEKYLDSKDFIKAALAVISPENLPIQIHDALAEIGKTIPTHPQLGSGSNMCGVVINYIVRALAVGKLVSIERVLIDLDDFFDPSHKEENYKKYKNLRTAALKKMLGMED